MRAEPEGPLNAVLVLTTRGATQRTTVVRPDPFSSSEQAADWLATLRRDERAADTELASALAVINRALRAQRAAAADPYAADVSSGRSLAVRIGYGSGEAVADGRVGEAFELRRSGRRRTKRSMEAPEERFAALLGGRKPALVGEELVLRARGDLDAGRAREAALQARVALEALLAELPGAELSEWREPVSEAANAAIKGEPRREELERAVQAMEGALRRHRLGG